VEIEQRRCISRYEESFWVNPRGSQAGCSLADGEATEIARAERRKMTGHARDVAVPAQDLVERKCLAQLDERRSDERSSFHWSDPAGSGQLAHLSRQMIDAGFRHIRCPGRSGDLVAAARQTDQTGASRERADGPVDPHARPTLQMLSGGTTGEYAWAGVPHTIDRKFRDIHDTRSSSELLAPGS